MTALAPDPSPVTTDVRDLSTEELVRAVRDHDALAWGELVARYQSMVHGVVRPFRLPEADRADTVQNTWMRALERIETLRDPERLGGWLSAIAQRESLATLRRSGREVPVEADAMELAAREPGPEPVLLARETRCAVARAVEALPPQRRAFVHALFYQPEPCYSEISRLLVMPTGSIGPTRQRVLSTLRSRLTERGYASPSLV